MNFLLRHHHVLCNSFLFFSSWNDLLVWTQFSGLQQSSIKSFYPISWSPASLPESPPDISPLLCSREISVLVIKSLQGKNGRKIFSVAEIILCAHQILFPSTTSNYKVGLRHYCMTSFHIYLTTVDWTSHQHKMELSVQKSGLGRVSSGNSPLSI